MDSSGGIVNVLQNGVVALGEIAKALRATLASVQSTATTAAGGTATLPANPVGFINMTLPNGTAVKVPYYGP